MDDLPAICGVHQLSDGRWEIIGLDSDQCRPPWHRLAIVSSLMSAGQSADGSHADLPRARVTCKRKSAA
jgi:hypothetical protein